MPDLANDSLLARLAGQGTSADSNSWAEVAATQPQHAGRRKPRSGKARRAAGTLAGYDQYGGKPGPRPTAEHRDSRRIRSDRTDSLEEAQLTPSAVEGLFLKLMLSRGDVTGRQVSEHIKLPFRIVDELLRQHEERSTGRSQGLGADERLLVPVDRHRPRTGPPAGRPLHVLRLRASLAQGLYRRRERTIADPAASDGRRSASGLSRIC